MKETPQFLKAIDLTTKISQWKYFIQGFEGSTRLMGFNEKYLIKVSIKKDRECEAPWTG